MIIKVTKSLSYIMLFDKSKFFKKIKNMYTHLKKKEIGLSIIQFAIISLLIIVKR